MKATTLPRHFKATHLGGLAHAVRAVHKPSVATSVAVAASVSSLLGHLGLCENRKCERRGGGRVSLEVPRGITCFKQFTHGNRYFCAQNSRRRIFHYIIYLMGNSRLRKDVWREGGKGESGESAKETRRCAIKKTGSSLFSFSFLPDLLEGRQRHAT